MSISFADTQLNVKTVGYRKNRLHLCGGVRHLNECPRYDIKNSNGKAPTSEICGMWSSPSLPLLPVPLLLGVVAPDRVQSMGQI